MSTNFKTLKDQVLKTIRTMKKKIFINALQIYYGSAMRRYLIALEQSINCFDESIAEDAIKTFETINPLLNKNVNQLITNIQNKDVQTAIINLITEGIDEEEIKTIRDTITKFLVSKKLANELDKHKPIWTKCIEGIMKDANKVNKILSKLL